MHAAGCCGLVPGSGMPGSGMLALLVAAYRWSRRMGSAVSPAWCRWAYKQASEVACASLTRQPRSDSQYVSFEPICGCAACVLFLESSWYHQLVSVCSHQQRTNLLSVTFLNYSHPGQDVDSGPEFICTVFSPNLEGVMCCLRALQKFFFS